MDTLYLDSELLNYQFMQSVSKNINVSFELFPPNTQEMEKIFWMSLIKLSELTPSFISITSGVNFRNHDYVYNIIQKIRSSTGLIVAPHLTCVNCSLEELRGIATRYWDDGIRNVVALRGDSLNEHYHSVMYAVDLVLLLKEIGNFDISVAAYPEVHPEAISAQSDLLNLKRKVDAGANRAITQFFFDVDKYLRFRDLCVSSGISVPIIPGIFPVFNFRQLKRFVAITRVVLPRQMLNIFCGLDSDLETQKLIGVVIAMEMIKILISEEVNDFHFYTLNRFELTYAICCILGLKKGSQSGR